jgi:ABC-type transporter Mla subunit MlaD
MEKIVGLFDNLKDKISDAVGIDADQFVEATEQVAEVTENVADTAEAIRDTRDTLAGE